MIDTNKALVLERDEFKAQAERLMERVLALEWLVEVQEFQKHRLRNPGEWNNSKPGSCLTLEQIKKAWERRANSTYELHITYEYALSAGSRS